MLSAADWIDRFQTEIGWRRKTPSVRTIYLKEQGGWSQ